MVEQHELHRFADDGGQHHEDDGKSDAPPAAFYRRLTRTKLLCEAGVGVTYARGNPQVIRCGNTAVWAQTRSPWAALCDDCKRRLAGE